MVPPLCLNDAEDGREAEARALAGFLGREERLEHARARRAVHADAGVGDREHHVRAGRDAKVRGSEFGIELDVGGLDRQRSTVGHRVARVDDEVHHDLLDLSGVREDRRRDRLLRERSS